MRILETQAWLKTPVSILYLSQCLAFQGQKGILCGSDLLSVFPIAGLISVSHSGTCCRGAVYYRLIKAVNDNGNPVSNLRYYPDLSLSPSSHQAIKVTSFREHSHLPSVSPLMLFFLGRTADFLGLSHMKIPLTGLLLSIQSLFQSWDIGIVSLSLSLNALLSPLVFLQRLEIMKWAEEETFISKGLVK